MKWMIALLIALSSISFSRAQAQALPENPAGPSDEEAFRKGAEAIQAGRFADAANWMSTAVKQNPRNPVAQMELGVAELRLGKPVEASSALRQAIALQPDMQGANLFLGIAYTQMNRLDDAVAALEREIGLNPQNSQAQMWLGVVEMKAGHPEKATGPLDRAAELSPNDLNILEYRGKAHSDVAHDSYARMASIDPNSWHVHKVQGQLFAMQDKHTEAIAEFVEAIRNAPGNSDLYEELGNEYRKSGALDLAKKTFQNELELSPNNPIAMYNLAGIDIERNQAETGVPLLLKVISNYANAPAAYYFLGLGQSQLGKPSEAVAALEKALTMHPEPELAPRIEYELSRAYRKLGKIAESDWAIKEYRRLKAENAKKYPALRENADTGQDHGQTAVPVSPAKN